MRGPWDAETVPAAKIERYLSLLYVEGAVNKEREGLGPGDTLECDCYQDE